MEQIKIPQDIYLNIKPYFINDFYEAFQSAEYSTIGGDHYIVRLNDFAEFDLPTSEYELIAQQMVNLDQGDGRSDGKILVDYAIEKLGGADESIRMYFNTARFSESFEKYYDAFLSWMADWKIFMQPNMPIFPAEPGILQTSLYAYLSGYDLAEIAGLLQKGSFFKAPTYVLCDPGYYVSAFTERNDRNGKSEIYMNICFRYPDLEPRSTLAQEYRDKLLWHEDLHLATDRVFEEHETSMGEFLRQKMEGRGLLESWNYVTAKAGATKSGGRALEYNVGDICLRAFNYYYAPQLKDIDRMAVDILSEMLGPQSKHIYLRERQLGIIYLAKEAALQRELGTEEKFDFMVRECFTEEEYSQYVATKDLLHNIYSTCREEVIPLVKGRYPGLFSDRKI